MDKSTLLLDEIQSETITKATNYFPLMRFVTLGEF